MKVSIFKGDNYLDRDGYKYIKEPLDLAEKFKPMVVRGYIPEHRYIMAKNLDRLLSRIEQVHHKDKNRSNNILDNLELVNALKHINEHKLKGDLKLFSKDYQPHRMKNNTVREMLNIPKKENNQFNMGMKTELEHKDITKGDPILTGKIVKAHLKETDNYYTKLHKMENTKKVSKFVDKNEKQAGFVWNSVKNTAKAGLAAVSPTYRGAKLYQAGSKGKAALSRSIASLKRLKSSASEEFTRSGIDRIRGMLGKGRSLGDKVKDTLKRYKGSATSNDEFKSKAIRGLAIGGGAAAAGLGALALIKSKRKKEQN